MDGLFSNQPAQLKYIVDNPDGWGYMLVCDEYKSLY